MASISGSVCSTPFSRTKVPLNTIIMSVDIITAAAYARPAKDASGSLAERSLHVCVPRENRHSALEFAYVAPNPPKTQRLLLKVTMVCPFNVPGVTAMAGACETHGK
jgi:hypothetical protein